MKTQEEVKNRIEKMNQRIEKLWDRFDNSKTESISKMYFDQIKSLEKQVNLLCWVLGREEIH